MVRKLFRALLLLLMLVGVHAVAQPALPDTPPGRLLRGWLETFNAGDIEPRAKFVEAHYATSILRGATPRQVAERGLRFRENVGGGFDLYAVTRATETEIAALLRERGGFGWAEIALRVDATDPERIAAIDIRQAPTPPEARPARLADAALAQETERLARRLAAEDRFSGVILIAKDGRSVFQRAYGYQDREQKVPNNLDTKFRIGSMNKMFTSVAIAQLVAQGRLGYDDPLVKVLPDYPDKEVAAKITVHHLLTHTSGLGDYFGDAFDAKKDGLRHLGDYLPFFAGKPLQFEPGQRFAYSNAGMLVAGLVVEKVSGQNYFEYVREHVYKPAGMNDSGSWEKSSPQPNQSKGYMEQGGKWVSNYDTLPLMGSSAGGGDSTAPDLLRFDQALRAGKLLPPDGVSRMIGGRVELEPGEKYAYGFEERIEDGERVVGHGGGAPGMNCDLRMYWDSGYTVIVMSNFSPPIAQQISRWIDERLLQ